MTQTAEPLDSRGLALDATLAALGLIRRPCGPFVADQVFDLDTGELVFRGRPWEVWDWLADTGRAIGRRQPSRNP